MKGSNFNLKWAFLTSLTIHLLFFVISNVWSYRVHTISNLNDFTVVEFRALSNPKPAAQWEKTILRTDRQSNAKEVIKKPEPKTTFPPERLRQIPPVVDQPGAPGTSNQVNMETNDFPFAYYLRLLRQRIQENWDPPYQATDQGRSPRAVITFQVQRNGAITNMIVQNSSGIFLFDTAAQRAVRSVGTLPPLPDAYLEETLRVTINFEVQW